MKNYLSQCPHRFNDGFLFGLYTCPEDKADGLHVVKT